MTEKQKEFISGEANKLVVEEGEGNVKVVKSVKPAETIEEIPSSQLVWAEIRRVKHDMNPVTLSSWTRIVCDCEDGVERKMSFDGENGMYLSEGDTGMLEHRDGVFVSFEKDSGEVVAPLYHIPAEEK